VKVTSDEGRYIAPPSRREHGSRAKYTIERCRCLACTVAQREYNRARHRGMNRPDEAWVKLVPATRARRYLEELAAQGIGYKTVCAAVGVAPQTVRNLFWPRRRSRGGKTVPLTRRIRPELEQKILSFRPEMANGAQKVPAGPTWELLDDLLTQGFYKAWIAEQLGSKGPGLQVRRSSVRASTARKVERLHREWSGRTPPAKRSRWSA
jgi:hypothetical protein